MLENLNNKNNFKIYSVNDIEFKSYGRVIEGVDTSEIISAAKTIPLPDSGTLYVASEEKFEGLEIAKIIKDEFFGQTQTQVGYCHGKSSYLNAAEWHTSSEINIALTPLVLLLAHTWQMCDNKIDSSLFKAFYLPQGTMIECFATTLHFCPCQVQDSGFGLVVALPLGTNTELETKPKSPYLFRKNKWIIAHNDNSALIGRGVLPGIFGDNIKINY